MTAKFYNITEETRQEKAILVGVIRPGFKKDMVEESLQELALLADTAGVRVSDRLLQVRKKLDFATLIGIGKVRELGQACEEQDADLVIFDDELSPAQVKNLERELKKKILDRSNLILDIFANRARTREAQTQVELAQLEYLFPRLTRQWTHLSRQEGGVGTRGPGETQLETDRRLIRKRIDFLKRELTVIERQRQTRRKSRHTFHQVALIGYTNAGKSSLMKALSDSDVFIEDRLFATLDAKIRQFELPGGEAVLLIDTVGFIRKLPHHLVASFRSTLEEISEADLLLHVIDISHPHADHHIQTTLDLIKDLNLHEKTRILVFNKVDALKDRSILQRFNQHYENSVYVSAVTGLGLRDLLERIQSDLRTSEEDVTVRLPVHASRTIDFIYQWAQVLHREYEGNTAVIRYRAPAHHLSRIQSYLEKHHGISHSRH